MNNTPQSLKRGFTLMELAIVLVIIGLLVGGLLGMVTYLRNAKVTTMMNESKFYMNAYNQFQTRYNAPPGDYCSSATVCGTQASPTATNVWSEAKNGDGNGLIRAAGTVFPNERFYAFQHLALAGFIPGRYTGLGDVSGTGATIGVNVPGTAVEKSAFLFDHPNATDGFVSGDTVYFDGQYGNILTIAGLNDNSTGVPSGGFLTPKQALQLDEKYDDGKPGLGTIVVQKTAAPSLCTNNNTTAATFNTATDAKNCYIIRKM